MAADTRVSTNAENPGPKALIGAKYKPRSMPRRAVKLIASNWFFAACKNSTDGFITLDKNSWIWLMVPHRPDYADGNDYPRHAG